MKKLNIVQIKTVLFIIVAILLSGISLTVLFSKNNQETNYTELNNYNPKLTTSQETEKKLTITNDLFKVSAVNGKIAVFKNNEEIPVTIETVKIQNLPNHDKELLEKGVEFERYYDLIRFLENYE